jgi:hypothetical protein
MRMDWLSKHQAKIVCQEKTIRIPLTSDETLSIQGEKSNTKLMIILCMKAQKCLRKGYHTNLAHVTEKSKEKNKFEEIPVIRDYAEVFPEDLPGLPPVRQVEFRIDLTPRDTPVAKASYRLAPSEMHELSNQLQELLDKDFI